MKGKISEEDQKKVIEQCDQAIAWLENNQLADKEEYQQKELEKVCSVVPSSASCIREECQQAAADSRHKATPSPRAQPLRRLTKWT